MIYRSKQIIKGIIPIFIFSLFLISVNFAYSQNIINNPSSECKDESGFYISGYPVYCEEILVTRGISLKGIVKTIEKGFKAIIRPIGELVEGVVRGVNKALKEIGIYICDKATKYSKEECRLAAEWLTSKNFCNYVANKVPSDYSRFKELVKNKFNIEFNNPDGAGGSDIIVDFNTFAKSWDEFPFGKEKGQEIRSYLKNLTPTIIKRLKDYMGNPDINNKVYIIYVKDFENSEFNEYGEPEIGGQYRSDLNVIFLTCGYLDECIYGLTHELAHAFNDNSLFIPAIEEGFARALEVLIGDEILNTTTGRNYLSKSQSFAGTLSSVYQFRSLEGLSDERYNQSAYVILKILERDKDFIKRFKNNYKNNFSGYNEVKSLGSQKYTSRIIALSLCELFTKNTENKIIRTNEENLLLERLYNEIYEIFKKAYNGDLEKDFLKRDLEVFRMEFDSRIVNEIKLTKISENMVKLEGRALFKRGSVIDLLWSFLENIYNVKGNYIEGGDLLNYIKNAFSQDLGIEFVRKLNQIIIKNSEEVVNRPVDIELITIKPTTSTTMPLRPSISPAIVQRLLQKEATKLYSISPIKDYPYTYELLIPVDSQNVYQILIRIAHNTYYSTLQKECSLIDFVPLPIGNINCLPEYLRRDYKDFTLPYFDAYTFKIDKASGDLIIYRGLRNPPKVKIVNRDLIGNKLIIDLEITNPLLKNNLKLEIKNLTGRTIVTYSKLVDYKYYLKWEVDLPFDLPPGKYLANISINNELFENPSEAIFDIDYKGTYGIFINTSTPPRTILEMPYSKEIEIANYSIDVIATSSYNYELRLSNITLTSNNYWPFSKIKLDLIDSNNKIVFNYETSSDALFKTSQLTILPSVMPPLSSGRYTIRLKGITLNPQHYYYPYRGGLFNFKLEKVVGMVIDKLSNNPVLRVESTGSAISPSYSPVVPYLPHLGINAKISYSNYKSILVYEKQNNIATLFFTAINHANKKYLEVKLLDKNNLTIKDVKKICSGYSECPTSYQALKSLFGTPHNWAIPLVRLNWASTSQYTFNVRWDNCSFRITNDPTKTTPNNIFVCQNTNSYFKDTLNLRIEWVYLPQTSYMEKVNYEYLLPNYYYSLQIPKKSLYTFLAQFLSSFLATIFNIYLR
jgi:hypothetical protein